VGLLPSRSLSLPMAALLGPRSIGVNDRPRMYQGLAIAGLSRRVAFPAPSNLASRSDTSGAAEAGAGFVGWPPQEAGAGGIVPRLKKPGGLARSCHRRASDRYSLKGLFGETGNTP
jgi:hypothetical protein